MSTSTIEFGKEPARCRLYRGLRNVMPGQDLYLAVRDTEEEPRDEKTLNLPEGAELVATFVGTNESVHAELSAYREEHNYQLMGPGNPEHQCMI
jgi:hypothetical protein